MDTMKTDKEKSKTLSETKVETVLTEKPPSINPQDSLQTAGDRMREMKTEDWPVAEEKKLLGMMDQPDPDRTAARFGHDPKEILVGQTMSRDVAYCYEDQSCAEALELMDARRVQFLPVLNRDERIAGIVSRAELVAKGEE
jgi:CBS domain-containing protein